METVIRIVSLCMKTRKLICEVNDQTIKVTYYGLWKKESFESFHTDETMKEYRGFSFMPLSELENEVLKLIS